MVLYIQSHMSEVQTELIEVGQLGLGMFIDLELGWMSHPFPKGNFKISSEKQIDVIRGLGVKRVRYFPGKSDLLPGSSVTKTEVLEPAGDSSPAAEAESLQRKAQAQELRLRKQRGELLDAQQRGLAVCERQFGNAMRQYRRAVEQVSSKPREAMEQCLELINTYVADMAGAGESAIRLLSEGVGDKAAMHPVNVTVVSLLLGKSMDLPQSDLVDLGMAAFLHDIGKIELPDRVRWREESFSSAEYKLYQQHVGLGVTLAQRMGLTAGALQAIGQHHEMVDGSGFPARLKSDRLSTSAKILALVNRYDSLCNPSRPAAAITPHEALALIFAQLKVRFDSTVLSAFVRMMGVYPVGSVVQLVDDRFALVVSTNSSRPLKPRIMVHDPGVPKHEALILDLEQVSDIGIRRSLKPDSLPRAAMDYLSPRHRICYFFEKAVDSSSNEVLR